MTRNKVAVTNNCSAMTVVFTPQVEEAIHQTINRTQQTSDLNRTLRQSSRHFLIRIRLNSLSSPQDCRDVGKVVPNPLGGLGKGVPLRYCFKRRRVYQLP